MQAPAPGQENTAEFNAIDEEEEDGDDGKETAPQEGDKENVSEEKSEKKPETAEITSSEKSSSGST